MDDVATMNTAALSPASPMDAATPVAGTKKQSFQGPCYLKMLVSNLVAGSIIGKNGAVIGSIESESKASMKLSPTNQFFPTTNDRIVVMSGEQAHINRAMAMILEKIGAVSVAQFPPETSQPQVELNCKIVVPKSAVSGIIGKAGQQIKQLQEVSGAKIQISNREQGLNERVVSITGTIEKVHTAGVEIATVIQEDANLKDHMYVIYTAANGGGGGPAGGMYPPAMGFGGYGQFVGGGAYPYGHFGGGQAGSQQGQQGQPTTNELEQLMNEACEIVVEVPDAAMGPVIGKAGIHLTEIMRSTGANIKLSQKGDFVLGTQNRKVTINGTVSSVHRAHARLLLRLKESGTNGGGRGSPMGGGSYGGPAVQSQMPSGHAQQTPQASQQYGHYGLHAAPYAQLPGSQFQYSPY